MQRKIFFIFLLLALTISASTQKVPAFKFDTLEHDFGTISLEKDTYSYAFKFTNTGDTKLVVTGVKSSCACTTATYPKDFIAPGKEDKIVVTYTTGVLGNFKKALKVFTNKGTVTLQISGYVVNDNEE